MGLLASEPAAPVRSLDELLAIAYSLEHEAAEHYTTFAARMRQDGLAELADLFEKLAAEERHHEQYVLTWSQQKSGKMPDAAALRWTPPETFDLAAGTDLASSHLASAYRILALAVQNEDRAFALWSYIAAHAGTDELRAAAESMARTELQHAWQLRRARRHAYHADGRRRHDGVKTLSMLLADEAHLTNLLDRAVAADAGATPDLQRLAHETRAMAGDLIAGAPQTIGTADQPSGILILAERLTEDYLDISDKSQDEAEVARAQALAERAVMRLAQLRELGVLLPGRKLTD